MGEGRAFVDRTVFGRGGGSGRQGAVGLAPQEVFAEEGAALHERIGHFAQEGNIAGVVVVVPQVDGQPRGGHGVVVPRHIGSFERGGEAEYVGRYARCPAACSPICLSCPLAGFFEQPDEVGQRLGTFGQIGGQRGPVVHLEVDVVVVVDAPRPVHIVMPHALQVGGQVSGPRRGDEQIAAELVVEAFERTVFGSFAIVCQPLVGGFVRAGTCKAELHAVEQGLVVAQVGLEQAGIALALGLVQPFSGGFIGIYAHIGQRVVPVGVVVGGIVRVGREEQVDAVGSGDLQLVVAVAAGASLGHHLQTHGVAHVVVVEAAAIGEAAFAVVAELPFAYGAGSIGNLQVLPARLRGREAYDHDIGGIGHEGRAVEVGAVGCVERDCGQSGIERQGPAVMAHARLVDACGYAELAHRGEGAEAELGLSGGLVGHSAVEVLLCEVSGLVPVSIEKSLAYFGQEVGRLLVLRPIVLRPFGRVGATPPEGLFVQRVAFGRNASHHVAANAAIAERQ